MLSLLVQQERCHRRCVQKQGLGRSLHDNRLPFGGRYFHIFQCVNQVDNIQRRLIDSKFACCRHATEPTRWCIKQARHRLRRVGVDKERRKWRQIVVQWSQIHIGPLQAHLIPKWNARRLLGEVDGVRLRGWTWRVSVCEQTPLVEKIYHGFFNCRFEMLEQLRVALDGPRGERFPRAERRGGVAFVRAQGTLQRFDGLGRFGLWVECDLFEATRQIFDAGHEFIATRITNALAQADQFGHLGRVGHVPQRR